MDSKAYIRTLEAIIAIILVLIVIYAAIPKNAEKETQPPLVVKEAQEFIINEISGNESLRQLILTSPDDNAISTEVQKVILAYKPANYDFLCAICKKTDGCIMTTPIDKSVYMSDVFIASIITEELSEQQPKIVRFWMWEKPSEGISVNACGVINEV